ncbi:unnamed protein product, partial [Polarella glacialis]
SLSINTCVWICAFANNQFGENFGVYIDECPFIRVLEITDLMVLIVDRGAGSLTRVWCGVELYY